MNAMAFMDKGSPRTASNTRRSAPKQGGSGWLSGILGGREIEKRVDENFPSWQEYSGQKIEEKEEQKQRLDLPPHRIYISSPLHGNFLFIVMVVLALALGIYSPELGPVLIYGAIAMVLMISLFVVFRDGLFFHIEALRLEHDANMINKHNRGPKSDGDDEGDGFMRPFSRKGKKSKIFRSRLLQIHYQNVLRTFDQGNRRTWVNQDASIADLYTLLSQRGMKLVWTMIEVLPQLGLLGTMFGLMRMFSAFRADVSNPEVAILSGFGTALGTTVVANILVLILRPLYMRNDRSMHEVLSTIQTLMATFILPTQESVLERTQLAGLLASGNPKLGGGGGAGKEINENRLLESLSQMTQALGRFTEVQQQVDSGAMAMQTAEIAEDVRETLHAFQESVDRDQMESQQRAFSELTAALQMLAGNLGSVNSAAGPEKNPSLERIEHDLTQMRVLTHDTLLLLEQISGRLGPASSKGGRLLSKDQNLRASVFPGEGGRGSGNAPESGDEPEVPGPVRLFKGPA